MGAKSSRFAQTPLLHHIFKPPEACDATEQQRRHDSMVAVSRSSGDNPLLAELGQFPQLIWTFQINKKHLESMLPYRSSYSYAMTLSRPPLPCMLLYNTMMMINMVRGLEQRQSRRAIARGQMCCRRCLVAREMNCENRFKWQWRSTGLVAL